MGILFLFMTILCEGITAGYRRPKPVYQLIIPHKLTYLQVNHGFKGKTSDDFIITFINIAIEHDQIIF